MHILLINGPNLNLLGLREPSVYGSLSLDDIVQQCIDSASKLGAQIKAVQYNSEGDIIDAIHDSLGKYNGIVINAGAYTHYSYAIRDAISSVKIPVVEVHISNIYAREEFRHHSVISPVAIGQICGFGANSYMLGIRALVEYLENLDAEDKAW